MIRSLQSEENSELTIEYPCYSLKMSVEVHDENLFHMAH